MTIEVDSNKQSKTINILCWLNGVGLSRDANILKNELSPLGHTVRLVDIYPATPLPLKDIPPADINIFIEHAYETLFPSAKKNYYIPNPEWCQVPPHVIKKLDLILCRTHEVERIFSPIAKKTYYIGFASIDRSQPKAKKDFSKILHLRGQSIAKGTTSVLNLWYDHPKYPELNLISFREPDPKLENVKCYSNYLSEDQLLSLQNQCGIHLCPSETEGFGHYIGEALSVGAVVVTTDAPPMNEFITDTRCLVKAKFSSQQNYATNYYVDDAHFEEVLSNLLALPKEELMAIGKKNRKAYLEGKRAFKERLKQLFNEPIN